MGKPNLLPPASAWLIVDHLVSELNWTHREIGAACFMNPAVSQRIRTRYKTKFVHRTTHEALVRTVKTAEPRLAVKRDQVPVNLTRAAIRGLVAQGYAQRWIAEQLGVTQRTINYAAHGTSKTVNVRTERRILALVREIGSTEGPSNYARTIGRNRKWKPTMYIDDLV